METEVFLIVLFSAFLHASWNSMASKYKDKNVSIGAIVYGHVPLCIVAIIFLPSPSIESLLTPTATLREYNRLRLEWVDDFHKSSTLPKSHG